MEKMLVEQSSKTSKKAVGKYQTRQRDEIEKVSAKT